MYSGLKTIKHYLQGIETGVEGDEKPDITFTLYSHNTEVVQVSIEKQSIILIGNKN